MSSPSSRSSSGDIVDGASDAEPHLAYHSLPTSSSHQLSDEVPTKKSRSAADLRRSQ
ncbi:hypothetical protein Pmar_PMAR008170, partial [Perkinsus marinus ATCC 50983]